MLRPQVDNIPAGLGDDADDEEESEYETSDAIDEKTKIKAEECETNDASNETSTTTKVGDTRNVMKVTHGSMEEEALATRGRA